MKERPILFSAPMVRAILGSRKTVTRRVVRWPSWANPEDAGQQAALVRDRALALYRDGRAIKVLRCPHGATGTRLWVREQFSYSYGTGVEDRSPCWYWADGQPDYGDWSRPAPSIRMPRWASRITLEVTGVRVERLQEISDADAMAEGVEHWVIGEGWREYGLPPDVEAAGTHPLRSARDSFASLWESINGPGSWEANPFVWVIEFRRVS